MDTQINDRVQLFLDFMKTADGAPLVSVDFLDWLISKGFFTAPASTKYHGAREGGLFEHSFAVAKHLTWLTTSCNLTWQEERSPKIVGMFHDLCKIDQYRLKVCHTVDITGDSLTLGEWEYNPDMLLKGHGDKSVMLLSQFENLTEEEIACIRYHMGAFTPQEEWKDYTRAIHFWPNVLWTHQADMLAAHVTGV